MIGRARVWSSLTLAAIAVLLWVVGAQARLQAGHIDAQHLNGSWIATVTTVTPAGVPPLTILATFTEDGSIVGSAPSSNVSAAHGAWARTGNGTFALTAVYLRHDGGGTFLGT